MMTGTHTRLTQCPVQVRWLTGRLQDEVAARQSVMDGISDMKGEANRLVTVKPVGGLSRSASPTGTLMTPEATLLVLNLQTDLSQTNKELELLQQKQANTQPRSKPQ